MTKRPKKPSVSIAEEFLEDVTREMNEQGISRSALAGRLGCTKANVSKLLERKKNITITTAQSLADALDLDLILALQSSSKKTDGQKCPEQAVVRNAQVLPSTSTPDAIQKLNTKNVTPAEARTVWLWLSPQLKRELRKIILEEPKNRGRKPGPLGDYSPHLNYAAQLIVGSGMRISARRATERACEWAEKRGGLAHVSPRTLRGYFAQDRAVLLRRHETVVRLETTSRDNGRENHLCLTLEGTLTAIAASHLDDFFSLGLPTYADLYRMAAGVNDLVAHDLLDSAISAPLSSLGWPDTAQAISSTIASLSTALGQFSSVSSNSRMAMLSTASLPDSSILAAMAMTTSTEISNGLESLPNIEQELTKMFAIVGSETASLSSMLAAMTASSETLNGMNGLPNIGQEIARTFALVDSELGHVAKLEARKILRYSQLLAAESPMGSFEALLDLDETLDELALLWKACGLSMQ